MGAKEFVSQPATQISVKCRLLFFPTSAALPSGIHSLLGVWTDAMLHILPMDGRFCHQLIHK